MTERLAAIGLLLLLAVAAVTTTAKAEDASVLIIDSSGSMAETLGKETRLDAARSVIADEVSRWPAGRELALVAYGHRRAGDCKDIETLLSLGPVEAKAVRDSLSRLRARGKTPLSASLRHAAALLPAGGGNILLVSDGLETCHEDPCAVAEALRKAHAGLTIHVIGFGLSAKDMKSLACIAGSGGRAIDVQSGAELSKALGDVSVAVPTPPAPAVADAPSPAPPKPAPAAPAPPPAPTVVPVRLAAVIGDQPVPGVVRWRITPAGVGTVAYEGDAREIALDLPAGRYRVEIAGSNAEGSAEIRVEPLDDAAKTIAIDAGLLQLSMVLSPGRAIADADIKGEPEYRIEPLDGQKPAGLVGSLTPAAMLAPGRYRISGRLGPYATSRTVAVAAGKVLDVELDLQLGRVTLEAAVEGGAEPIASGTSLDWTLTPKDGATEPQSASATARPAFLAAAGSYDAALSISGATLHAPVEVVAGSEVTARVTLPSAALTLEAALAPGTPAFDDWRDATWTVKPVALIGGISAGPALDTKAEARPVLTLTPGIWRVSLTSGSASVTREIILAPKAVVTERLDLGAARLAMMAMPQPGASPPINVVFSVHPFVEAGDASAPPLFSGGAREELATILPAGRYHVTAADEQGRQAASDVTLGAGDTRQLNLELR